MTARRQLSCCAACFNDRHLIQTIVAISEVQGACSFCGTAQTALLAPTALADLFAPLVTIYEESDEGRTLVEWFADDWNLFNADRLDEAAAVRLLAEVLNNGEITRALFQPSARFSGDGLARWERLRNELMYVNRFFPDANLDVERLNSLLPQLVAADPPRVWYRARLMDGDTPFTIDQMGPPPARRSSHGRANPPGIPYLYLGSEPASAVAEVRPHTGETACVADFTLREELRLVDLRDPRLALSPFSYGDEDQIGTLRADLALLGRLGEELTRPVLPQGAAIDYVPSQYLCELIKKAGYDGVLYRSAVGDAVNLALFEPDRAQGGAVVQHRVQRVVVELE